MPSSWPQRPRCSRVESPRLRPKRRCSMTALVRRCRPVRQSRRVRIRGTRRMIHQPELAVRLPAMRGFLTIVTPTLRPYRFLLLLPLPTHRADNRGLYRKERVPLGSPASAFNSCRCGRWGRLQCGEQCNGRRGANCFHRSPNGCECSRSAAPTRPLYAMQR
jgi:hypothetical protein